MKTIKYYADRDQYMGWNKLTPNNLHNQVLGWIRSGNTVVIGGNEYGKGDFEKIIYREL